MNFSQTSHSEGAVRLVLRKAEPKKKVGWSEETVDNENMNKRKSKCKLSLFLLSI